MKTIRDLILERFVQKEINIISGKIADEISLLQSNLAHEIAREQDSDKSDKLKQRYKELTDLFIRVAVNSTCADVDVEEIQSAGILIERMIREVVTT